MNRSEYITYCLDNGLLDIIDKSNNMTDIELAYAVEASKYPKRRNDGQQYSDYMGAKLVLLNQPDDVKKLISDFFATAQSFLCEGWWKSALREMQNKQPTPYVNQQIIDEVTTYIQNYVNTSY